jgi:crescentin
MERTAALARAFTAKEAALTRAENTIAALNEQVAALESTAPSKSRQPIRELRTQQSLRREQMQCSVVEGALETAGRISPV